MAGFRDRMNLPEAVDRGARQYAQPTALEVGRQPKGGAFAPLMMLVFPINPVSSSYSATVGDFLQATRAGEHHDERIGVIMSRVQLSGHTGAFVKANVNGKRVTGESIMRGILDLYDLYYGHGRFQGPKWRTALLEDGEVVNLADIKMRFYCLDEPQAANLPPQGAYNVRPEGYPIRTRQQGKQRYNYAITLTILQPLSNETMGVDPTYGMMFDMAEQYRAAYDSFASDAKWAYFSAIARRAAEFAADMARYRRAARNAMSGRPWERNDPMDFETPPGDPPEDSNDPDYDPDPPADGLPPFEDITRDLDDWDLTL